MSIINILPARDYRINGSAITYLKDKIASFKGKVYRDTYLVRKDLVEDKVISEIYVAGMDKEIFPGDTIVIDTLCLNSTT